MLRYPGGKRKLVKPILSALEPTLVSNKTLPYLEPFLGSGAVLLEVLKRRLTNRVIINDSDPAIASIWSCVLNTPEDLCNLVSEIKPSVDLFFKLKEDYNSNAEFKYSPVELAAYKIALHQMSYSGLGSKAGGPIGGKSQTSKYKVDCRWNPQGIIKQIKGAHLLLASVEVLSGECFREDYLDVLQHFPEAIAYLDPPYYEKGPELYHHAFSQQDHEQLQRYLIGRKSPWVLSYDASPFIQNLYSKYKQLPLSVNYSINGSNYTSELLILGGAQ